MVLKGKIKTIFKNVYFCLNIYFFPLIEKSRMSPSNWGFKSQSHLFKLCIGPWLNSDLMRGLQYRCWTACAILSSRNAPVESSTKKLLKTSTHSSSHKEVSVTFLFTKSPRLCFFRGLCCLFRLLLISSVCRTDTNCLPEYFKLNFHLRKGVRERQGEGGRKYLYSLESLAVGSHHYAKILPEEQERKH